MTQRLNHAVELAKQKKELREKWGNEGGNEVKKNTVVFEWLMVDEDESDDEDM